MSILLVLAGWVALSLFVDLSSFFLPTPLGVFKSLYSAITDGSLFVHLSFTLLRVGTAVLVGGSVGIPLGVCCGLSKMARRFVMPIVDFARGIPTSLLFPVFIVFLGINELAKVSIAIYATTPIFIVGTLVGVMPRREAAGRHEYLNLHKDRTTRTVRLCAHLWDAIPNVVAGIKLAVSVAMVLVIVTEMFFVSSSGIGWAAHRAYLAFDIDLMYAYILLIGTLGYLFNWWIDRIVERLRAM